MRVGVMFGGVCFGCDLYVGDCFFLLCDFFGVDY